MKALYVMLGLYTAYVVPNSTFQSANLPAVARNPLRKLGADAPAGDDDSMDHTDMGSDSDIGKDHIDHTDMDSGSGGDDDWKDHTHMGSDSDVSEGHMDHTNVDSGSGGDDDWKDHADADGNAGSEGRCGEAVTAARFLCYQEGATGAPTPNDNSCSDECVPLLREVMNSCPDRGMEFRALVVDHCAESDGVGTGSVNDADWNDAAATADWSDSGTN